jgi:hypothetical protein
MPEIRIRSSKADRKGIGPPVTTRRKGLALTLGTLLVLGAGCGSIPPVSSPPPPDTQYVRTESPLDWNRKASACTDAGKRAKRAAKELCRLASFSVVDDACECVRGLSRAGSWRCTAKGAYVCASSR